MAGWSFDEGGGTTAADVTGHGNTATLHNDPPWTAGRYGSGLELNGLDDYISIPNSPTINLSGGAMTLSAWVRPAGGGDQVLLGKFYNATMSSPYYQYGIELVGGGTWPVFYIGTPTGPVDARMGSNLPVGEWSHLAIIFTGSQAQFYRNGVLVNSTPMSATIVARDEQMNLGADIRPSQHFAGAVDDVRIYDRTLTAAEVQSDMATPLGGSTSGPTVAITSPANNATVGGTVTITADADDQTGVSGVQFLVDDAQIGPEDTVAPYGTSWDSSTVSNGAHTLTARARNTSGEVSLSSPINVTVVNGESFQNEILAIGLDLPTAMKFLPDGRMLVSELTGRIKVLPPPYTTPDPNPFLQINVNPGSVYEGIYDFALDPDFANNHYYYVFYTPASPSYDRLSRFTANESLTGTVPGSELVLYQDNQIAASEHHGGAIAFANDGKIMFTTGEHFDPTASQSLSNPRGKLHRINPDGSVPTDNPFYDGTGPNWDSIWASGLRNPFRMYNDGPSGRLFIADVGGNLGSSSEEVDLGLRAANYGWSNYEGPCPAPCTSPLYNYVHNNRDASITGGFVYHGSQFPASMQGNYFFADYAQNWIKRLTFDAGGNVTGVHNFEPASGEPDGPTGDVVYLTEGPEGALYYVDVGFSDSSGTRGISKIRRIRFLQSNQAPVAVATADPTSGSPPLNVSFSSAGSGDPEGQPITYSWDFGDGSSSTEANPTHTYTAPGQYTVRLAVSDGVNSTNATPLVIAAGSPPVGTIAAPVDGQTFRAGQVINYSGDATDVEDGTLPDSAFQWNIDFLHEGHVHPGEVVRGVRSGSFTIPRDGHDFHGNTRYRITLTVTDSDGLAHSTAVIVLPEKVDLSFDTVPSGLTLYLDGIARTTPFVHDTLVGFTHSVEARNQSSGQTSYTFASWSDGGGQLHDITVPAAAQSFTATFTGTPVGNQLAAGWGFNEGSGSTAADSSGNNNTATLVNNPTWVAGRYGSGLSFDGVDDYLNVPNSSSLDISGTAFTLSMWINRELASESVVLGKFWNSNMSSPFYQYGLELAGGNPHFYVGTPTGYLFADMNYILPLNQWSHLSIVFDGSQVQFYLNGTLVRTRPLSASLTARGEHLKMGADATPRQFFTGKLDDVRIYGRTLDSAQIQADMNTSL